jgi:hypothetical protein
MTVELVPVVSSTIQAIGYGAQSATLAVMFNDGTTYHYFGVPMAVHSALMSAASKGSYLDTRVKKAGYPYKRVG